MVTEKVTSFADGRLGLTVDQIARIEIAAPERRNAINQAMWAAIPEICAALAGNESVRAVILSARAAPDGPVFSAGADISEFETVYATPDSAVAYNALVRVAQAALRDLPLPVIAAIDGPCVGGGCGLALSADLRFASAGARLAITPARLGIAYSWDDTTALIEKVGPARAKDMLFSGRMVGAAEALAIGLVDRIHGSENLMAEALAYAQLLTTMSPRSIKVAKATVNRIAQGDPSGRAAMQPVFDGLFSGPDFAEGRAAFRQRRAPEF